MKTIQWFPGHMAKAMREMAESLSLCDAVCFVLDARCPASSYNPRLTQLAGGRPILYVLAKADLSKSEPLLSALREGGKHALSLDLTSPSSARKLVQEMEELLKEKATRLKNARAFRVLVAGVPNTGKSTLINLLAGGKRAQTGDKAGVTRSKQWVKCGTFDLLDTPGTMPPAFEDQTFAQRLAFVGSINDDILAMDEIALALLETLSRLSPQSLLSRYGKAEGTPLSLLEAVCVRRGFVLRGGEYDFDRGAFAVVDDFRKGKLGKFCLDSTEDLFLSGLLYKGE